MRHLWLGKFFGEFRFLLLICFVKNYIFISAWCGCGQSLNTNTSYGRVADNLCDMNCIGNVNEKCGAFRYANLFLTYCLCVNKPQNRFLQDILLDLATYRTLQVDLQDGRFRRI